MNLTGTPLLFKMHLESLVSRCYKRLITIETELNDIRNVWIENVYKDMSLKDLNTEIYFENRFELEKEKKEVNLKLAILQEELEAFKK